MWSAELLGFFSFGGTSDRKDRKLVHLAEWGVTLNLEAAGLLQDYSMISLNSVWGYSFVELLNKQMF